MEIPRSKRTDLIWIGLISVIAFLVHLLTYNILGFHRDEYLYLAFGHHLAAGYWSNPPLIGIISFLVQLLPGNGLFTARLFPSLAGACLIFLTGLTARELGGRTFAQVLACIALLVSVLFLRAFSMLQPVSFDILCWSVILFLVLRYINTESPGYLIFIGIAFGLGMLNKYMVVFLATGLALGMIPTIHRRLYTSKYTGYAVLLAILILMPNLGWQYAHGFPVFHHMRALAETQLVNVKRTNILADQILMFTVSSVVWIAGVIWLLGSQSAMKFRIFGYTYLAVLFFFLVLRGKSYYMAGMYPFLMAAGGVHLEKKIPRNAGRILLAAFVFLLSLPVIPGAMPVMSAKNMVGFFNKIPRGMGGEAFVRWEDGKTHPLPQDFADMLGWDELGNIVVKACDTIQDKKKIMIYCENYGQAGVVDYCGRCHNLPEAVSFADNYLLWAPDSIADTKSIFIYVNNEIGGDVDSIFSRIDKAGSISNPYAREYGTKVFICRSPRIDFTKFWIKRVKEVKAKAGI